ncbi:MAG: flagellar basal body P-ring protein FlgI [Desulfobacteraceae bacterium]|nr:flagellar basal body P-ring protein FlgI [Desulfobacteraceae bacterium]
MNAKGRLYTACIGLALTLVLASAPADCARIKDIAYFLGSRSNALIGYGLVVGLNGSGDNTNTLFTVNTLANLLDNMGIHVDPTQTKTKNVAAVMVTAKLPAFARIGARIDLEASSIGDAKSLEGGTLLMTPLKGPDGKVYAVAQGPISTGGFSVSGASGSSVQKNHPTVGFISGGALVEKEVAVQYAELPVLDLVLKAPDFTTATKTASAINGAVQGVTAKAVDAGTVKLEIPPGQRGDMVAMITKIENLNVQPEVVAKVVVNERTGTIVIGENVRISPVAVAHGSLTVQITEKSNVSQPMPFSQGQTAITPQTSIQVQEGKGALAVVGGGITIGQVIKGLNAIGATPRDLINILQSIKAAGAMQAELELI